MCATGASAVRHWREIQSLWSGYGTIARAELEGGFWPSVIVKYVSPPTVHRHPRGWATSRSHERKLRSYDVEKAVYETLVPLALEQPGDGARPFRLAGGNVTGPLANSARRLCVSEMSCRVPVPLVCQRLPEGWLFILEDLDAGGFDRRCDFEMSPPQMRACLDWLANWHARFMEHGGDGLWPVGTYWHLHTRPDEWAAMPEGPLKRVATQLDERLSQARFLSVVHGDAKAANFCFPKQPGPVAAVDFQYTGKGCGMKDVAYFFSSCLEERACAEQAPVLLDHYFQALRRALTVHKPSLDAGAIEEEWRSLYPLAWADFYRFLLGWAPEHYKVNSYSGRMAELALAAISR